jgi:hypothetical protein
MIPVSFVALTLMAIGVAFLAAVLRGFMRGRVHAGEMRPNSHEVVSRRKATSLLFIVVCLLLGVWMVVGGVALVLRASPDASDRSVQGSAVVVEVSTVRELVGSKVSFQ